MSKKATWLGIAALLVCSALEPLVMRGQNTNSTEPVSWHPVGNFVVNEAQLAGPAGGPVERVWYAQTGVGSFNNSLLFVVLGPAPGTRVFQTADLETWRISTAAPPASPPGVPTATLPEASAKTRSPAGAPSRVYAFGADVYRSDDGGVSWENKTRLRGQSIVGGAVHDLAIAPGSIDEITIATDEGVFHSADGGDSWTSLNEGLPNLPAARLLSPPGSSPAISPIGVHGVRIVLGNGIAAEWSPGQNAAQNAAWSPTSDLALESETALRRALAAVRGAPVTTASVVGDYIYSGTVAGGIAVSADRGATWREFSKGAFSGAVNRFWVDTNDPLVAVAVLGTARPDPVGAAVPSHVLRTMNGGIFWDDITLNLPDTGVNGVAADRASHAIYVATDQGVFLSYTDLSTLGAPGAWSKLNGAETVPAGVRTTDVMLDPQGNQLWMSLAGYGVFAALPPHRERDPRVVSAADWLAHAAAPGSLLSILGMNASQVRVGNLTAPVLAASPEATQIQIPFNASGTPLAISADSGAGVANRQLALPPLTLAAAAPVIFVAPDGSPLLLVGIEDGAMGMMPDAAHPIRSGSRIQILATGLGRVTPDWPTGLSAPANNPPQVEGTVHAFIGGASVPVNQATLAPGYVGLYLIEITVPKLVNYGPNQLSIDVDGAPSNRVQVYIQP